MRNVLGTNNKTSDSSIIITVVRNAEGLQPTETYGYISDADAEAYQVFAPAQSRLQEHREWGATRGINIHGKISFTLSQFLR